MSSPCSSSFWDSLPPRASPSDQSRNKPSPSDQLTYRTPPKRVGRPQHEVEVESRELHFSAFRELVQELKCEIVRELELIMQRELSSNFEKIKHIMREKKASVSTITEVDLDFSLNDEGRISSCNGHVSPNTEILNSSAISGREAGMMEWKLFEEIRNAEKHFHSDDQHLEELGRNGDHEQQIPASEAAELDEIPMETPTLQLMSNLSLVDGGGDNSPREKEEAASMKNSGPLKNSRPWLTELKQWSDADEAIERIRFARRISSTSSLLDVYKKHANVVDSFLTRIIHSAFFRLVMSLVIVANTVLIGSSTEHNVKYAFEHKKQADQANERLSEVIFTAIFTAEIALRIFADRWQFFARASRFWNIFDTVLVVQALVVVVAERTQTNQGLVNMSFARVIRILRFARVLRLVRVIRLFRGFKIMVHCLAYSIFQLMWVFFMLLFVLYFFAVVILQGVSTDVGKIYTDGAVEDYELLKENFGDLPTAIVALFMVITGRKDWSELYTPLANMNATYGGVLVFYIYFGFFGGVLVFYIYFAFFGVLNVVTSVFVDATYNAAQTDPEIFIEQELDRSKMYTSSCVKFFLEADKDLTGSLTRNGFLEFLSDAKAAAFFNMLELDESQAEAIYTLLDPERKDSVDIEDFVEGCSRLRGGARSIDVNMLLYANQEMLGRWTDIMDGLQDRFNVVENKLGIVHSQIEAGAESQTLSRGLSSNGRSARSAGETPRQPWSLLNGAVLAVEQSQGRHSNRRGSSIGQTVL